MADTKISALVDGVTAVSTDRIPVSRAGVNKYITPGYIQTMLGLAAIATSGSASDLSAGTVAAARGGAGAITGALKGNGAGVVSQAAASDLSNGVTGSGAVALATGAALTSPTLTTPIIGSYTYATLPSAAANSGAMARITDIGPATAGSLWLSNGTIWKPATGRIVLSTLAARFNRAAGLGEAIAFQYQMPAAFLNVLDRLRINASYSKAGTTTTCTWAVYIGPLGTTGDPALTGMSGSVLSAANRSVGVISDLVVRSATTITKQGSGTTTAASYAAAVSTAFAAATAISNISNSLYITLTISPGATDDVALEDCFLEYIVP